MNINNITVDNSGYLKLDDEQIKLKAGPAVIMLTNRFLVAPYPFRSETIVEINQDKLLELRIFDDNMELKLFRGSVGKELKYRYLSDADCQDYFDDEQYLDVDEKRSKDCDNVRSTGGGTYAVPLASFCDAKLKLRNYVRYDENGQCYIWDWRMLEFFNEEVK